MGHGLKGDGTGRGEWGQLEEVAVNVWYESGSRSEWESGSESGNGRARSRVMVRVWIDVGVGANAEDGVWGWGRGVVSPTCSHLVSGQGSG